MPSRRRALETIIVTCSICLAIVAGGLQLNAQVSGGSITGTIIDKTGSVLPNAQISVKNTATGVVSTAVTNSAGVYLVANVLPGRYDIKATAQGFAPAQASNLTVTVGAQIIVNLTVDVATVAENVQVSATSANVETTSSTISGVVAEQVVRDMPLNGRDWTQLATLEAGVSAISSQTRTSAEGGQRGMGTQMTVSGGRPQQNTYRIDGVNINDYSNGGPGSVLGLNLGVDAVAEFSVLTTNYSAEYGRTSGGVINAITRSGTNGFHGDAYYFHRNSALDALNYFTDPTSPGSFRRHQFGGAFGGPIKKDKTFFFFDFEGIRQSKGTPTVDTMPSPAARTGHLHDKNGVPYTVTVNPLVSPFLVFFPLPNGPLIGNGDTGYYTFNTQAVTTENFMTARVDHNFSSKDRLFGSAMYDKGHLDSPDATNAKIQEFRSQREMLGVEETHSFTPSFLNAVRFGVNRVIGRTQLSVTPLIPQAADASFGTVPGLPAAQIIFPGTTGFLGGMGGNPSYNYWYTTFQAYDDAFVTKGNHQLKFGVSFERMRDNMLAKANPNGVWKFNSLNDFLIDKPKNLSSALPGSITPRDILDHILGVYVQDDWKATHSLTLNLGLRYEISGVPTEAHGKLGKVLNMSDPYSALHTGDPYFNNPTLKNFEPKIGLAWDPTGSGKTAVRAGFGIFDVLPLPYEFQLMFTNSAPFFLQVQTPNGLPIGSFPTAVFSTLVDSSGAPTTLGLRNLRTAYVQPNPPRNYVLQWNLNVQRELARNWTTLLAYVGSRGIHQPFHVDTVNMVLPIGYTSNGLPYWPTPAGSGSIINPGFSRMDGTMWIADSYYHAFQAQVKHTMAHGVQMQGTYTWSRSIDTDSSSLAGDQYSNSLAVSPWFNPRLVRGLSDFNVSHSASISFLWNVPGARAATGALGWMANGWQFGGIYRIQSGTPVTPQVDGDILGLNSSDDFAFPDRNPGCGNSLVNPGNVAHYIKTGCFSFPAVATVMGTSRRNVIVGPGIQNFDLSLFKNNYVKRLSEQFNVQLRFEAFNVFNHPNFAAPYANNLLFDGTGAPIGGAGALTSTSTDNRELQIAVKVIF